MINGKVAEFRTCKAGQRGFYITGYGDDAISNSKQFSREVWHIKDSGLPLYTTGKEPSAKASCSGKFDSLYNQITTQSDRKGKSFCRYKGNDNEQSGKGGAGRFFSNKGCPKKRDKLRYHSPTIGCGSKNSHRFIIFLSLIAIQIPTLIIIYLLSF